MGRWKANSDGSAYWDANDSGPNQVDVPQGYNADGTQQTSGTSSQTPDYTQEAPEAQPGLEQQQYSFQPTAINAAQDYASGSYNPEDYQHLDSASYGYDPNTYTGNTGINGGYLPTNGTSGIATAQPSYEDFVRDYWAPDRDQVLASMQNGGTQQPAQQQTTASGPVQYQYMEGVDTAKLNDPTHTTPKYVASRILASGGSLADAAKAIGATVLDGDKMRLSTGEIIDIRRDQEGANALQWLVTYDPNDGTHGPAAGGAAGTGYSGGGGSTSASNGYSWSGTNAVAGQGDQLGANLPYGNYANSLYGTLMGRANQSLNVNARDPIIAGQVNAYRAEQDRSTRNQLAALAESGGPQNNLNQERRMLNESAARSTGGLQAQLLQNELTARRQEIAQALGQMGNMLSDEQKMALQKEMFSIDSQLRSQQIGNQNSQFYAGLGQDNAHFYSNLNQQNNQFLDQFGLNAQDRASYWDAVRSGLLG